MIERILENIIGLAAIGLFGIGLYEWYRREKREKEHAVAEILASKRREEINDVIRNLDKNEKDAKRNYEESKNEVLGILNKRGNAPGNSDSSNES